MILIIDISYYYLEPTLKKATWQKQSIECVYTCGGGRMDMKMNVHEQKKRVTKEVG